MSSTGVVTSSGLPCTAGSCLFYLTAVASFDTTTSSGAGSVPIPVDLLLNVSAAAALTDPVFSNGNILMDHITAYPGFEMTYSIGGYMSGQEAASSNVYVGFTVGPLPDGAYLSTVTGKGSSAAAPARMTLRWNPRPDQLGTKVLCYDVVNSVGVAATQQCLVVKVVPDVAPVVSFIANGQALASESRPPHQCLQSPCFFTSVYIGQSVTIDVVGSDANQWDRLSLQPVPSDWNPCNRSTCVLPPTATLGPEATAVAAARMTVTRRLIFAPRYDHGGYMFAHCFQASDSCGAAAVSAGAAPAAAGACPGVVQSARECVWVNVARCQYVVQKGQTLQDISVWYGTDWLQLWSVNPDLLNFDLDLNTGDTLHIGHEYAVQPLETAANVARRFGMDDLSFSRLNADVAFSSAGMARYACDSVVSCASLWWCIQPNSCKGASASLYDAARA